MGASQSRRAGQKLCGLEPKRAGGCLVWEQRKLEATPGNEASVQARLGAAEVPSGGGRVGWPLGRLRG